MPISIQVEVVVAQPFAQNALVAWRVGGTEAVVVDPGFDVPAILRVLDEHHLTLAAVLNTHGHVDHIAGNRELLAARPGVPLWIGRNEAHLLADPEANLSAGYGLPVVSPPADRLLADGERVEVAGMALEVREIVGHSPGSIVYICRDTDPVIVFGGDVLFAGSVGRCDFPGGSAETLVAGIRQKLFALPASTVVYPGHGPTTTVGAERLHNPYAGLGPGDGGPR